ncbi:MAG: DUF3810 domain-containing protein [Bacteroidota bacterium]
MKFSFPDMRSRKKIIWIVLGILALIIRYIASPEAIEQWYSRGLFLWIRRAFDYGIGWFPIPLFYVFYLVLIVWAVRALIKTNWKRFFTWKGIGNWLLSVAAFTGGVLFFFFFSWGFNYGRIPLVRQIDLQAQPVELEELKAELDRVTELILTQRKTLDPTEKVAINENMLPTDLEDLCRTAVEKTLDQMDYPTVGKVRGQILFTKGILMRFSSSGVYWPFVGQGNIDGGLHPLQQPFTLCHELSHGYGITNEGVCNFLGYLAAKNSDNNFIRYSGLMCYWRYLAIAYQRFAYDDYQTFRTTLPEGFKKDLDEINESLDRYPDILPQLRYMAYDTYLKSQGISEGMKSYSSIIMLVRAWEKREKGETMRE